MPGIEDSIYGSRKLGERHGDVEDNWKTWDRFDTKLEHDEHGGSNYAVMHPESDLMQMPNGGTHMVDDETDSDDRLDEQPCTLGCLNSEFLCPHSCQCVPKFTRVKYLNSNISIYSIVYPVTNIKNQNKYTISVQWGARL